MDKSEWRVPVSLDEPFRILFVDLYQLVLIVSLGTVGIVLDAMLLGSCIGIALAYCYGELLENRSPSFLVHLAHWYLPRNFLGLRCVPPGHLRLFVG